jgi:hypothetical protein
MSTIWEVRVDLQYRDGASQSFHRSLCIASYARC